MHLKKGFTMQLDFLEEVTEYKMLSSQVNELMKMTHNIRRNIFAQLNEHDKILLKLQDQIDFIRQKIDQIEIKQIK
jgi:hypothetical protein